MKKTAIFFTMLALCMLMFSGCGTPQEQSSPPQADLEQSDSASTGSAQNIEEPAETEESTPEPKVQVQSKRDRIPFSEGQLYAVAYLGYQQAEDLDYYVENYLDNGNLPTHYLSFGDFYLIIPRYDSMELSLSRSEIDLPEPILLYEDPNCQPFLLQCNVSDIFPDAVVRLTYENETVEFSPFISLKDGSVDVGPSGLLLTK